MGGLALALASLIVGVLATIGVSRYYFKRTTNKSLTPYLQHISSLFDGVDESVRESLKIAYKGTAVTELLEVQFLIANTGERPIRDFIAPLALSIPKNCSLLDASILHVSPEGREVLINQTPHAVAFNFPLLNSGEFFITKLLLQGVAKAKDLKFTITVDDLPPVLTAVRMPPELIAGERKRKFEWEPLAIGFVLAVIGAAISTLIFLQWDVFSQSWNQGLVASFPANWTALLSSAVAILPALLLLVGGTMLCVGSFTNFSFPRQRRFIVPSEFHRTRFLSIHPNGALQKKVSTTHEVPHAQ